MSPTNCEHLAAATTIVVLLGFAADAHAQDLAGKHRGPAVHRERAERAPSLRPSPEPAPAQSHPLPDPAPAGKSTTRPHRGGDRNRAPSVVTRQVIVQVQISGCHTGCHGLRQSQAAEQRSTAIQVTNEAPHARRETSSRRIDAPGRTRLLQFQLGCRSHCFGSTPMRYRTLPQSISRVVARILAAIRLTRPRADRPTAREQAATEQLARQLQEAGSRTTSQRQQASQTETSAQVDHDGAPSVGAPAKAPSVPEQTGGASSALDEQQIWQLQIGCVMHCVDTVMRQQADQSTAVGAVPTGANTDASARAPERAQASQFVTQVQIGCLSWCFDSTERQLAHFGSAMGGSDRAEITGSPAGASPPPEADVRPVDSESRGGAPAASMRGRDSIMPAKRGGRARRTRTCVLARTALRTRRVSSDRRLSGSFEPRLSGRCRASTRMRVRALHSRRHMSLALIRIGEIMYPPGPGTARDHRSGGWRALAIGRGRTCETCGSSSGRSARRASQREGDAAPRALGTRRTLRVCGAGGPHTRSRARCRSCEGDFGSPGPRPRAGCCPRIFWTGAWLTARRSFDQPAGKRRHARRAATCVL
jgi:hypothetical protein